MSPTNQNQPNQAKGQSQQSGIFNRHLKPWQWVSVLVLLGILISLFFIGDELLFLIFHRPPTPPVQFNMPASKARIKKLCILDQGKRFNEKCEGKEVVLKDLYLYPLTEKETFTDYIIFYSSDSLEVSPTTYQPDLFFNRNEDVIVIGASIDKKTERGKELFQKITKKLNVITQPVPVSITAGIKGAQMCTGMPHHPGGCTWGLGFILKKISFPATQNEATITTDKTEYEQGEEVEITIENNLGESIWYSEQINCGTSFWVLQKKEGNKWTDVVSLKQGPCKWVAPPAPIELQPKESIKDTWPMFTQFPYPDQKETKLIGPGTYRFAFTYSLNCSDLQYPYKCSQPITIYSNQFRVKEQGQKKAVFEKCIEASSWQDYFEKSDSDYFGDISSVEEDIQPISSFPIEINFVDVQMYIVPRGAAGGDIFIEPIIKSGNKYCKLTNQNAKHLFAPIQRDEAIEYLDFRLKTLAASAYGRSRTTILDKGDYEQLRCAKTIAEEDKQITTIKQVKDGFIIDWIWYTPTAQSGYYKQKVKIGYDASIETIERADEPFIECGAGIMF